MRPSLTHTHLQRQSQLEGKGDGRGRKVYLIQVYVHARRPSALTRRDLSQLFSFLPSSEWHPLETQVLHRRLTTRTPKSTRDLPVARRVNVLHVVARSVPSDVSAASSSGRSRQARAGQAVGIGDAGWWKTSGLSSCIKTQSRHYPTRMRCRLRSSMLCTFV
jgi:hypothetical protein